MSTFRYPLLEEVLRFRFQVTIDAPPVFRIGQQRLDVVEQSDGSGVLDLRRPGHGSTAAGHDPVLRLVLAF